MHTPFFVPLAPRGFSSISPPPPWHYAGDFLVIDFWARPQAVAAVLPAQLQADAKAEGHAQAYFIDWQFTGGHDELLDPARYQYREFFILVDAQFNGKPVAFCPYIFVDNDAAIARGWAQGFPKRQGSIFQTRTFAARGPACAPLIAGSRFGASASAAGQRIARGIVTLEQALTDSAALGSRPTINLRHFPRLAAGQWDKPAVHELVESVMDNFTVADAWMGKGELTLPVCEHEEISDLAPIRCGNGYRMSVSYSVTDLKTLVDHSAR
ncbi:acetoacetate decarboxylase family protein [Dyella choica]|uniref:Acetoacetate decarboxylase n=1 Tax=Dyella choica TaxID=1927959 RepID=A0A3S0Q360_9GAMM|nr:acetoacetate decarboxylase family protein [Dyella choica]RUL72479.1 acetoacetate decarboxylase [Dyella choica]